MLKLVEQIDDGDCATASLAMFLGLSYKTVLREAKKIAKNPEKKGLWISQIMKISRRFGVPLRRSRNFNFEYAEIGLLNVENYGLAWRKTKRAAPESHLVVIYKGVIYDPWGPSAWSPEEYRKRNKSKFTSVLWPK